MKKLVLAVWVVLSLLGASKTYASNDYTAQRQIECLTDNIYHESKGEPYNGQVAVGFVTMNRTQSEYFPSNVCAVVQQKEKNKCQFSWYCQTSKKKHSKKPQSVKLREIEYIKSRLIAEYVYHLHDSIPDPTGGALYFHAKYVKVKVKGKHVTNKISKHIFYDIRRKSV